MNIDLLIGQRAADVDDQGNEVMLIELRAPVIPLSKEAYKALVASDTEKFTVAINLPKQTEKA